MHAILAHRLSLAFSHFATSLNAACRCFIGVNCPIDTAHSCGIGSANVTGGAPYSLKRLLANNVCLMTALMGAGHEEEYC